MPKPPVVLVVDDELALLSLIGDVLRDEGFDVLTAANSLVAFEMLQARESIDVLVTDIAMPGAADGRALADFVARTHPGIRILVLSGRPVEKDAIVDGAEFMQKPFELDALVARLREMTGERGEQARA